MSKEGPARIANRHVFPSNALLTVETIQLVPVLLRCPNMNRLSWQCMGSPDMSRFHSPLSNLVLAQNLRQSIGNHSIFARLKHDRGDLDGAGPMMFAAAQNNGWLHARKLLIHSACVN